MPISILKRMDQSDPFDPEEHDGIHTTIANQVNLHETLIAALTDKVDQLPAQQDRVFIRKETTAAVNFDDSSTAEELIAELVIAGTEIPKTGEYQISLFLPFDDVQDKARGFVVRDTDGTVLVESRPLPMNSEFSGKGYQPISLMVTKTLTAGKGINVYSISTSSNADTQQILAGGFIEVTGFVMAVISEASQLSSLETRLAALEAAAAAPVQTVHLLGSNIANPTQAQLQGLYDGVVGIPAPDTPPSAITALTMIAGFHLYLGENVWSYRNNGGAWTQFGISHFSATAVSVYTFK